MVMKGEKGKSYDEQTGQLVTNKMPQLLQQFIVHKRMQKRDQDHNLL